MTRITFKQSAKKKSLQLTFFVFLSLFISGYVSAQKHWARDYVKLGWGPQKDFIGIATVVYDYSFGPKSEHGYLERCRFEVSADRVNYYRLMDIQTQQQIESNNTTVYFKNKPNGTKIMLKKILLLQQLDQYGLII